VCSSVLVLGTSLPTVPVTESPEDVEQVAYSIWLLRPMDVAHS
jgi:hypothetical protein